MNAGWEPTPLGDLLKRSEKVVNINPLETYKQVTVRLWGHGVILRDEVSGSEISAAKRYEVKPGQFILSKIDARNGAFGLVPPALDRAVVSGDFPVFDINPNRLEPKYLEWKSKTGEFVDLCRAASEGTTNRVRLKEDKFLRLKISLPPLPEQRRIVAKIEALAAKIEDARGLRRKAAEEAEAFFTAQVSTLFHHEDCWRKVGDAVAPHKGAVRSGPFGSQLLHEEFTAFGVAAIGTRDVQTNRFELRSGWFVCEEKFETLRRYQVFPGDVLCTIVGASIGRFCVVPEIVPLAFTTKHVQALTLHREIADPLFVSYTLNFHRRCRDSLFAQVEGSAQPSLNAAKVLGTELPLPSLPEQRRIVAYLDGLQAQVDALKKLQAQTAAELDALLPAILDRAFKGEL